MIIVTAAIIQNSHGDYLICQRDAGGSFAYLWEFPGGKLEDGETPAECIVRECREELSIELSVTEVFKEATYQYSDRLLHFIFFLAKIDSGVPTSSVHKDIKWVDKDVLRNYQFCPADLEIICELSQYPD